MIVVTHEIAFAREVADTVLFLDEGRIVEQGPGAPRAHRARGRAHPAFPQPGARPALGCVHNWHSV
ncbi:MAG: hypothetical protein WDN24_12005 [Sphingomonas sp.]